MYKDVVVKGISYQVHFDAKWIAVWEYKDYQGLPVPKRSLTFQESDIKFGPTASLQASWVPLEILTMIHGYVKNKIFW